ncbi:MAG TPA: branched-chain-amino-acid transaminase [bacterium]|nr:branched-chain-amino-acid transaminase [bacterium]
MLINLNGNLVKKEEAVVSVFDHGLLYGDGVFEGIRVYGGNIFRLNDHINRLFNSAKYIMLKVSLSKKEMIDEVVRTVKANNLRDGYLRLVVTRGPGDLGLDPAKCPKAFYFIIAAGITLYPEEYYEKGLSIITVPTRRNTSEALNPQVKSLNYLNNILAKIEAKNHNSLEAVMINNEGYVSEATGDNIFIVKDGVLITPSLHCGGLNGITRRTVLEIAAKLKIKTREDVMTRYELYTADECFLTGTAAKVIPVVNIDAREINGGKPGRVTGIIFREYMKLTKKMGVKAFKD